METGLAGTGSTKNRLMSNPSVIVLGGGLSGMAVAFGLAEAGWSDITIVERGEELGGLAGTFEQNGHFYPLAYHHILHRDRGLLYFLDRLGVLPQVRWRRIGMLFHLDGQFYNLADPADFLRFPMTLRDKAHFVSLMLRAFRKSDWTDWQNYSAADLIDSWGGPGVRRAMFEKLCRLKFDLPAAEISGAWLGARLHFREGSAPLGYVPGTNWTKLLCEGLARLLEEAGVRILRSSTVTRLDGTDRRIRGVELLDGTRYEADLYVSTLPTETYLDLAGTDTTPHLEPIRYTAVISAICATKQQLPRDFYWLNLASLNQTASGIFKLDSLNPTIGAPDDSCLNLMSHVPSRHEALYKKSDEEITTAYLEDFHDVFGFELVPDWFRISRLPMYSPIFLRGYRNPPVQSTTWKNVYFAGNYRAHPSIATTGTALDSGLEAAHAILVQSDQSSPVLGEAATYRLQSMPRG